MTRQASEETPSPSAPQIVFVLHGKRHGHRMTEHTIEDIPRSLDEPRVVLALHVSYKGTNLAGFSRQRGHLSVQANIEEALAVIFHRPIETTCAANTEAGVHARDQVMSFSLFADEWERRSEYKFLCSLNALTHTDIAIREVTVEEMDFSARFSARLSEYRYFICTDACAPLLMRDYAWHEGDKLNVALMREAADHLVGEHDLACFLAQDGERESVPNTVQRLLRIDVKQREFWREHFVVVSVQAYDMPSALMRALVGVLVGVGLGEREPGWVFDMLQGHPDEGESDEFAMDRRVPTEGLVFWGADYENDPLYDAPEDQPPVKDRIYSFFSAYQYEPRKTDDFVIPRGDGVTVTSGSALSEIKDDFDITRDYEALKDPTGVSLQPVLMADTDRFGEVLWEESTTPAIDEAPLPDMDPVRPNRKRYPFQRKNPQEKLAGKHR